MAEDWLGAWALNQMLINVSTRKFRRSVRLPDGDVGSFRGARVAFLLASYERSLTVRFTFFWQLMKSLTLVPSCWNQPVQR